MIRFDFNYIKPTSVIEAVQIMNRHIQEEKEAVYYGGGTELMNHFRTGKKEVDVVIDVKGIKELTRLEVKNDTYIVGAAVNLNDVIEGVELEPLKTVLRGIADHTIRNALTLGGNICGQLPYREAVLPLLMLDAVVVVATVDGKFEIPLNEIFDKRIKLQPSELLVQIKIKHSHHPYFTKRETESVAVDYPLLQFVSMKKDEEWFVGISGYGSCPVVERFEDNGDEGVVEHFMSVLKSEARSCPRGSAKYKQHLLLWALKEMVKTLKGGEASGN